MDAWFQVGARVRLVADGEAMPKGSEGVVIGYYAREPAACAVSFDGDVHVVALAALVPAEAPDAV